MSIGMGRKIVRIPCLATFFLRGNAADAVGLALRTNPFLKNLFGPALRSVLKAAAKAFQMLFHIFYTSWDPDDLSSGDSMASLDDLCSASTLLVCSISTWLTLRRISSRSAITPENLVLSAELIHSSCSRSG